MPRSAIPLVVLLALSCAGQKPPEPPALFPLSPEWKTSLPEPVVPPLAAAGRRLFVATREGTVRALDQATGETLWKTEGLAGSLTAVDGHLVVRGVDGTVASLHPRTGQLRFAVGTNVAGTLPAVVDGEMLLVAGRGLAALEASSGRILWSEPVQAEITTIPLAVGSRLLVGDSSGSLVCRDRASGGILWAFASGAALAAPPLVDPERGRIYLGTGDRAIVALDLQHGRPDWRFTVGGAVRHPGLLSEGRVLFAALDAVLYAFHPGGNLAWRAPLPSRPLSAPLAVAGGVLLACHESELLGFERRSGRPAGGLRTAAEIRAPPLVAAGRLFIGLRDRSVLAYALPAAPPPPVDPAR